MYLSTESRSALDRFASAARASATLELDFLQFDATLFQFSILSTDILGNSSLLPMAVVEEMKVANKFQIWETVHHGSAKIQQYN